MLQNAYFLAKIGADTAENERNFAEICKNCQLPYGSQRTRPSVAPDFVFANLARVRPSGPRVISRPVSCLRGRRNGSIDEDFLLEHTDTHLPRAAVVTLSVRCNETERNNDNILREVSVHWTCMVSYMRCSLNSYFSKLFSLHVLFLRIFTGSL